jgi:predicted AlkP superfamily pyrophosphatase or phosphodiesterase
VLVLVIDQLLPHQLDPRLPGGLGRLAREGRVFADAAHAHADTETCPGHAVILTGLHPGRVGIPVNDWTDHETLQSRYCVGDAGPDAAVLGAPPDRPGEPPSGRSPRSMRATALGDWLQAARPGARVFTVSGKDRSAIMLGGRRPAGAYWLDPRGALGFTTSRYYRAALPEWIAAWHGADPFAGWLAALPERWEHPTGAPPNGARPDDSPGEVSREGRTSGHPLRDTDVRVVMRRLLVTPWLDTLTLDFARTLIREERLGVGPAPDLLGLSLSGTDYIGHFYGPGSQEARDALLRLDADLARFLDALDAQVGPGRVVVALTSDHGVLDLSEWLVATGTSACPLEGGRVDARVLKRELEAALERRFGAVPAGEKPWAIDSGYAITVNRRLAAARGVPLAEIAEAARSFLATQPGVARVWTADEIARGAGPEPFATLYRRSYDPERSGDLVLQPIETCLVSEYPEGTSHGSPYLYDRAVPLVLAGSGIEPGVVRGRAAPVDLAPTLADLLGIPVPTGLDGQILPLR